jgi:two-component system response regulator RegX3
MYYRIGVMANKYDCLIVDDERALSESTCEYFNMFDVSTAWVADADACLDFLAQNEVSLILLDINLGEYSGFNVCKKLRESIDIPILFISARGGDDDVLLALGVGGDDYIQKPYSLNVLLAKVKAVLRRLAPADGNASASSEDSFIFGDFNLRFDLERLFGPDGEVGLTPMEFRLLAFLVRNRSRVISKEELFAQVWGDVITGDGTLNVHIRRLREKIEVDPNNPKLIKTAWGTGYVFDSPETPA